MTNITIQEMAAVCSGKWTGAKEMLLSVPKGLVVDSRNAAEGFVFCALRGAKVDGHDFIPDVLSKGVLAVLCEKEGKPGEPRLVVEDTLSAMQQIAAYCREKIRIPVIGVTGSVGKTTAKEMITSVLNAHGKTFKTPGSLNGQIGLPMSMVGLTPDYYAAVIEMGISIPGEMDKLVRMVQPNIAVFTNIGDAHLEMLKSREGILYEKSRITSAMDENGIVICNGDDKLLAAAGFNGKRKLTFGVGVQNDYYADEILPIGDSAFTCMIHTPRGHVRAEIPAYGTYMIYSVLAAAAVGETMGLTSAEIAEGLKSYQTIGHRSRVIHTPNFTVIDDCYNANPTSNRAAIDSMMRFEGRKVCILGDMREMGEKSEYLHRELGKYLCSSGIARLLTQGEEAFFISEEAKSIAVHYRTKDELIHDLPHQLDPGDVILIKASHGPGFEVILDALLELDK